MYKLVPYDANLMLSYPSYGHRSSVQFLKSATAAKAMGSFPSTPMTSSDRLNISLFLQLARWVIAKTQLLVKIPFHWILIKHLYISHLNSQLTLLRTLRQRSMQLVYVWTGGFMRQEGYTSSRLCIIWCRALRWDPRHCQRYSLTLLTWYDCVWLLCM